MENEANRQLELFTQSGGPAGARSPSANNAFLAFIWNYEKTILIIIAMVITGIVSFSLGVEKGRRVALISNSNIEPISYTIQVAAFKNRNLALRQAQLLARKGLAPLAFAKGNYIILCVGKFSNQESAQPLLIQLQRTYAGCRIRRL